MCKSDFALLSQMQQNCLWLHRNQHFVVFKPGSPYDFAQHAVLSNSLLSVCSAIQNILQSCSFKLIHALLALISAACCHVHGVRKGV